MRRLALCGLLVWLGAGATASATSEIPPDALEVIRPVAIQHNGRLKPFDSFARETIDLIIGKPTFNRQDPLATALSIMAAPSEWTEVELISVPFGPLREALGFSRTASRVSYNELVERRTLMRMLPGIAEKQQAQEPLSMLEHEAWDLYQRFVAFTTLVQQDLVLIPLRASAEREWTSVKQSALQPRWQSFLNAIRDDDAGRITSLAAQISTEFRSINPSHYPPSWRLSWEVLYNRLAPFSIARWTYLLTALLFLAGLRRTTSPWPRAAMGAFVTAAFIHAGGIASRVVLGGRPPVSNFYETMLWLPFVAVVLALIFERVYRAGYFSFAAALLSAVTLTLAEHVPLDSSMTPVVAVLRSNLWLTIHVLTIVASYGSLALATVLAHVYGWMVVSNRRDRKTLKSLDLFLYRTIQVGVVLLTAGVMLGAVWANASWGRYWGWDPKETWALITLLWFVAILHGRFAGWLNGIGVALSTIAGFFLLLMTYYGVSFYLVGLHSYAGGHAKPLPALLVGYLIAEVAFLGVVGTVALRRKRAV